jgi:hypothetical protein
MTFSIRQNVHIYALCPTGDKIILSIKYPHVIEIWIFHSEGIQSLNVSI